jgi:hypothetical protein
MRTKVEAMRSRAEEREANAGGTAKNQTVTVRLSDLAFEALAGEERNGSMRAPARTESAIRVYLGDRDSDSPAWPFPGFLRGSEPVEADPLELYVAADLWEKFEKEAERQGVSSQQLLEHAAFYFAAELNAGRITQRILDDLDAITAEGEAS